MKKIITLLLSLLATTSSVSSRGPSHSEELQQAFIFATVSTVIGVLIVEGIIPCLNSYLKNCFPSSLSQKNAGPETWAGPLPKELERVVDQHKRYEKLQAFNLTHPHGYLLYGPPGTGKTLLADILARKLNIPLLKETSGNFFTMFQGSGTLHFAEILRKAHRFPQPKDGFFKCIIFVDEIDGITSRAESFNREELRLVEQLLTAITAPENNTILFIGATNLFGSVDKALIRSGRLTPIYIGYPDTPTRRALFQSYFKKHTITFRPPSLDSLAESTEGFSCADIKHAIENGLYFHIKHPTIPFTDSLENALAQQKNHRVFT
jgi:cell division protease FtsH